MFATGARDGNIMVWDLRCNRRDGFYQPVNIIHHAHTQQASVVPQKNRRRGRRPSVPQPVSVRQLLLLHVFDKFVFTSTRYPNCLFGHTFRVNYSYFLSFTAIFFLGEDPTLG